MGKRQTSIPADKVSVMDDMEFDRISYQGTDVASEKGEKVSREIQRQRERERQRDEER